MNVEEINNYKEYLKNNKLPNYTQAKLYKFKNKARQLKLENDKLFFVKDGKLLEIIPLSQINNILNKIYSDPISGFCW